MTVNVAQGTSEVPTAIAVREKFWAIRKAANSFQERVSVGGLGSVVL